jgi:hypothetical protein
VEDKKANKEGAETKPMSVSKAKKEYPVTVKIEKGRNLRN